MIAVTDAESTPAGDLARTYALSTTNDTVPESKKSDVLYVICLDCTYVASTVDVTNDES